MNISDTDILRIIPQLPPFVMVDKLLAVNKNSTTTEFLVTKDTIFVESGMMNVAGIVENIAQTCAAGLGYANIVLAQDSMKIGFLAAIKDMIINRLPKIGERLITQITILGDIYSMTLVEGKVYINGEQIVHGNMKIFMTNMENAEEK